MSLRASKERALDGGDALVERLREMLEYDPETGELFWRRRPAGTINSEGYSQVSIDGKTILSHRVIFAMMTGAFPSEEIDHKDRDRANNKWDNLKPASRSQNMMNTGLLPSNTTGFRGVSWHKKTGAWHAKITVQGVKHHLGYFDTVEEAARAYNDAKVRFFGGVE
ncbi:HNH endonuclease [uncultured Brevundimonas sp.]|jgi:hypothetical protein|uniref:HNH endonuclease n=1 Tax=uncultured Brevundimonas sp. TaxID=213418 RepID=UPI0026258B5F|nr:HNH endonuclease [uncultured Brevundimonas sp.]